MSDAFPFDVGGSVKNPFAPLFNFNTDFDVDNVLNDKDDYYDVDKDRSKMRKRQTRKRFAQVNIHCENIYS
jgi:hypothetical protein